ncbi:MAG: hypothetical protein IH840_01510, partial [Candidatus Heimdallarchaeota archaeon]|nr:hypothetical protein [Candidatus Heimdallarchaeota archaeon]
MDQIVRIWINHPTPSLRDFVEKIVGTNGIPKPIASAALVMLDEYEKLEQTDPDFQQLDIFLKDLDPLLGSLLFDRVKQIKAPMLEVSAQKLIQSNTQDSLSLKDLIRIKDYDYLWEHMLQFPFSFVCELVKLFYENEWEPRDSSSYSLYEILIEQLGIQGWKGVTSVKWAVLSKKSADGFQSLSSNEIEDQKFDLVLSDELINRPDRIKKRKFVSRGHLNLVDPRINLFIYENAIRKSDFDDLLHIPIYSSNGYELAEFVISATSVNHFMMDEDGTYFTVRNKEGLFSIDIDALATFLLPISEFSEQVVETIPTMIEKSHGKDAIVLQGLGLLASLHRGREYTLWDLKDVEVVDEVVESTDGCSCVLAIDVGNSLTKMFLKPMGKCSHQENKWEFPSIIHYTSPTEFIIGQEVIDRDLRDSSQTFQYWKMGLIRSHLSFIRIRNMVITSKIAYQNFVQRIYQIVTSQIEKPISKISINNPSTSDNLEIWVKHYLEQVTGCIVEVNDESTVAIFALAQLQNIRGNLLFIDIGSSRTKISLASLDMPKSRKRSQDARLREKVSGIP